jgi:hypothetical protein
VQQPLTPTLTLSREREKIIKTLSSFTAENGEKPKIFSLSTWERTRVRAILNNQETFRTPHSLRASTLSFMA